MPDADIEIKLLGDPSIKQGDADLTPTVRKSMALVAYLALEGPTHRDRLADLLWSDMEQKDARRNLRQELWRLQRSLLNGLLESKSDQVFLRSGCSTDVQHFQSKLAQGDTGAALEGYGGPLLAHSELSGAAQFEDWLEARRDALSALHKDALQQHAETLKTAGDLRGALGLVLKLLHEDEFQEVYQREAMRLHLNLGERGAALLRFERYARLLEEELGLQPLPETEALARSLHDSPAEALPKATSQGRGAGGPQGLMLPLVGREAQWDTLAGSTAALTVLTGEPGVGKTRLTETFAATFGVQLHLRFFEVSLETPLYPAAEALRTALADPRGRERLSFLDPVWRTEAARLVPELEPVGVATPQLEGRARFLTGVARALMCAAGPEGVLIFDDLHWADPSSLELLLHLTRARHDSGPRLLATARSRELSERSLLGAALTTLEREGRLCRITLLPLIAPEVLQLVQILSGNPAQLFATRLFEASSGNPLYLLETLRHLFETGALRQDAAGEWSTPFDASTQDYAELPLPSSVRNAIVQRSDYHGPAARRLLEAASLLGEGFGMDDLAPTLSLSDWEALEALEGLLEAGLMTRSQGGGYGFSHELVRRVMLEELSPERRRLIHRRLAERLEKTAAPAGTLAYHLEAAGLAPQAAKWRVRSAQNAAKVYAHREALEHYRKALEDGLTPLEAFAVRAARAQLYQFLGEMAAREAELGQMERLAQDLEPSEQLTLLATPMRTEVQLSRAAFFLDAGQYAQALEQAERVLSGPGLTPEQRAQGLRFLGHSLGKLGRTGEGETHLRTALEGSEELSAQLRGSLHNDLTNLAVDRGDLGAARKHNTVALECFRVSGELRAQAIALNSSARIAHMGGDEPTALISLQNALGVAQTLGDVHLQVMFLHNVVQMQVDRGYLSEALEALNAGLSAVSEPRSPVHEGMLRSRAADVYRLQGELGAALESDLLAIRLADEIGALNVQITRRVHHAHFRVALGDLSGARRFLTEAHDLGGGTGEVQVRLEVGWAELELAQGHALEALGRLDTLCKVLKGQDAEPGEAWTSLQLVRVAALLAQDPLNDARALVPHLPQRPALRAFALRIRLRSSVLDPEDEAEVRFLLTSGRVPPLEVLQLKLTLAHALSALGTLRASEVSTLRAEARALHLGLGRGLSAEQGALFGAQLEVWMNPRALFVNPHS